MAVLLEAVDRLLLVPHSGLVVACQRSDVREPHLESVGSQLSKMLDGAISERPASSNRASIASRYARFRRSRGSEGSGSNWSSTRSASSVGLGPKISADARPKSSRERQPAARAWWMRLLRRVGPVLACDLDCWQRRTRAPPDLRQTRVILGLLEQGQSSQGELFQPVDIRLGVEVEPVHRGGGSAVRLASLVAEGARPLGSGVADRRGSLRFVVVEGDREIDLEVHIQPVRARQLQRPAEQAAGGLLVAAPQRASGRGSEAITRALGERCVGLPELGFVASCLFKVIAEDLVQLDQVRPALLEPVGELLVELGARRLGERVVGCVPDQQVAETEAVLARQLGAVGTDQLPRGRAPPVGATPPSPRRAPALRRDGRSPLRPRRARGRSDPEPRAGRGGRRAARAAWEGRRPLRPPRPWRASA